MRRACLEALAGFVLVILLAVRAERPAKLPSCQSAQLQCHARRGCQMALTNFFIHCHSLVKGEKVVSCPVDCKHALVSLLSTEDETGFSFMNCDCRKERSCLDRKRRVEVCQLEVLDSMHVLQDEAPPVSCNLARYICEADTSCLAALQYYYDHCSRLFRGIRCTAKCRNSLAILSRQPHASKLRSCQCDGSEDYNCQAVKVNTENLCLHRKKKKKKKMKLRRQKKRNNTTVVSSSEKMGHVQGSSQQGGTQIHVFDGNAKETKRRRRRFRPPNWKKQSMNLDLPETSHWLNEDTSTQSSKALVRN